MNKQEVMNIIKVDKGKEFKCLACEKSNVPVAKLLVLFGCCLYLCQKCILIAFREHAKAQGDHHE